MSIMNKKLVLSLIVVAMLLCTACGSSSDEETADSTETTTTASEVEVEEEVEVSEEADDSDTEEDSDSTEETAEPQEEVFSREGFTITLDDSFSEARLENVNAYYVNEKCMVMAMEEPFEQFEDLDENSTLEDYAQSLFEANGQVCELTESEDGKSVSFEYTSVSKDVEYAYHAVLMKTDTAFWMITFGCHSDTLEEYRPIFEDMLKTVVLE